MKRKKSLVATTLSVSAATLLLSGATAIAASRESTMPGTGQVVAKVGKIVPLNLLSGTKGFSFETTTTECCGPYQQCHCPDFKGAE